MDGRKKVSDALLSESEATLRLVDTLLGELRGEEERRVTEEARARDAFEDLTGSANGTLATLAKVLGRAYGEIMTALETLRNSRSVLQQTTLERVHRTHAKLQEVSSATELAATDMLNGLDRALQLLDLLDAPPAEAGEGADPAAIRNELREEIFRLISCLQFQDITSQQLSYVSNVLVDVAERLQVVASLFDISITPEEGEAERAGSPEGTGFDPGASMLNAEARQAVADEIFPLAGG